MFKDILIAIIAIGVTYYSLKLLIIARNSNKWLPVDGKVIRSRTSWKSTSESGGYVHDFEYGYDIAGVKYVSRRKKFGNIAWNGTLAHVHNLVEKYPEEIDVQVYYDPETPTNAVLQPGATTLHYFFLLAGPLVFLILRPINLTTVLWIIIISLITIVLLNTKAKYQ
ncbi:MAG: DUF3592 domain-containing protein [Candidatus Heimdallarchaeota archaeon]|nr:DUF3592 domain-containing protein [Candidatus Heimdallarchaeota archaeon]